ncbi:hypothetical protein D3C80_385930 [compost metagenome]
MTSDSSKVSKEEKMGIAVKKCIVDILSVQLKLRKLNCDYNWSNIIGDYGEMMAIKKYNLTPAPKNTANYDAKTACEETVQIKTCRVGDRDPQIGFRGECTLMLVSTLEDDGSIVQVYFGPFAPVYEKSRDSGRDNKRIISIAALKKLAKDHANIATAPCASVA